MKDVNDHTPLNIAIALTVVIIVIKEGARYYANKLAADEARKSRINSDHR
jgi:hypothetical protein